jgi:hypothetical protein
MPDKSKDKKIIETIKQHARGKHAISFINSYCVEVKNDLTDPIDLSSDKEDEPKNVKRSLNFTTVEKVGN